jgi:hypothetical protein
VVDALALDLDDYARSRVLQPITRFRTGVIGGPSLEDEYGRPVSYGILRSEFDAYLLRRSGARGAGRRARRAPGARGPGLDRGRRDACAPPRGGGRPLLPGGPPPRGAPGARPRGRGPGDRGPPDRGPGARDRGAGDTPELYFCADLKGYGWAFRKGDRLNVGSGASTAGALPARGRVPGAPRVHGPGPADLPTRWHGHAYLLYEAQRPRLVDDGALLVGDAAGLAYAASGEGIRPAVESAGWRAGDPLRARPLRLAGTSNPIGRALAARFGHRDHHMSLPIPAGLVAAAGRQLFRSRWFAKARGPRPVVPPRGLAVASGPRASPRPRCTGPRARSRSRRSRGTNVSCTRRSARSRARSRTSVQHSSATATRSGRRNTRIRY